MTKPWRFASAHAPQYLVFVGLSAAILVMAGIAQALNGASFQRFFGRIHPLLFVSMVSTVGLILFSFLVSDGQSVIFRRGNSRGILLAVGMAAPLAAAMMLVDAKAPLPADINVAFPDSLLFYPVMGYVAGILLDILPFCVVYFTLGALVGEWRGTKAFWVGMLIAASVEAVFQVAFAEGQSPVWATTYVGLNVFLIGVIQLLLLRRYDFITMYSFRLSYYLLWHVLWGHLRLGFLF